MFPRLTQYIIVSDIKIIAYQREAENLPGGNGSETELKE